jgi:hypothetical protein
LRRPTLHFDPKKLLLTAPGFLQGVRGVAGLEEGSNEPPDEARLLGIRTEEQDALEVGSRFERAEDQPPLRETVEELGVSTTIFGRTPAASSIASNR